MKAIQDNELNGGLPGIMHKERKAQQEKRGKHLTNISR